MDEGPSLHYSSDIQKFGANFSGHWPISALSFHQSPGCTIHVVLDDRTAIGKNVTGRDLSLSSEKCPSETW